MVVQNGVVLTTTEEIHRIFVRLNDMERLDREAMKICHESKSHM